ncbi:hypothetical protein BV22DRAFT_446875 [Leucogyrophana mollusca]|uniref:Uncharacterized protein n=1 Tax=Leucogyrophana mollusca TaxID=85980 RepID=A0ACB8BHK4_9AGAM|nr:hypothetical protein BV22DRAFT_446875 [Leucogyrophana mollusca]
MLVWPYNAPRGACAVQWVTDSFRVRRPTRGYQRNSRQSRPFYKDIVARCLKKAQTHLETKVTLLRPGRRDPETFILQLLPSSGESSRMRPSWVGGQSCMFPSALWVMQYLHDMNSRQE